MKTILFLTSIFLINFYSSTKLEVELVWIDKNINNKENTQYQKIFKKFEFLKLSCFDRVSKGMDYLKSLKFRQTIIITSGSLFPEFIQLFKNNINQLLICPKIIIFTSNREKFLSKYKNNPELSIQHPFFNSGSVQDTFQPVLEFLMKKKDYEFVPFFEKQTLETKD